VPYATTYFDKIMQQLILLRLVHNNNLYNLTIPQFKPKQLRHSLHNNVVVQQLKSTQIQPYQSQITNH
jgi:hypothetical protein